MNDIMTNVVRGSLEVHKLVTTKIDYQFLLER
jgi:hypothetical protein